jgi:hypothetical protein
MATKTIYICDGCGKELDGVYDITTFELKIERDSENPENDYMEKAYVMLGNKCCASDMIVTLLPMFGKEL